MKLSGLDWFLLTVFGPVSVFGHGNIQHPPTWFDKGGEIGLRPGGQCAAGAQSGPRTVSCMWFSNNTNIPGPPSLPDYMRTFNLGNNQDWSQVETRFSPGYEGTIDFSFDWTATHPWRAPGTAPVFSPCGVAGGNPDGCPVGGPPGICPGGGFGYGPSAERVTFQDVVVTDWSAGAVVTVGWGIIANHGGGYSYRLCKKPEAGAGLVTEECFQERPLKFHGDTQWVQYGEDGPRVEFLANRTTKGTWPPGSQWTKNPIPACSGPDGGYFTEVEPHCLRTGPQFPPPAPALLGFGQSYLAMGLPQFLFTVMDKVEVPADLSPGEYVLSFRWDCEQTPQIWNGCSSIRITTDQPYIDNHL